MTAEELTNLTGFLQNNGFDLTASGSFLGDPDLTFTGKYEDNTIEIHIVSRVVQSTFSIVTNGTQVYWQTIEDLTEIKNAVRGFIEWGFPKM